MQLIRIRTVSVPITPDKVASIKMIPGKMDLIKTAIIRMVRITRITMKTAPIRALAEMVDSIMDRASVGPEMAARADMVKAARDEEDRVEPVAEREIPVIILLTTAQETLPRIIPEMQILTENPAIAQIPLLPAIPVQNPGEQTPEVPVPIV